MGTAPPGLPYTGPMNEIDPVVLQICRSVRDEGGRACLVGGWVRDLEALRLRGVSGFPASEYDLEVYRLPAERLASLLGRLGVVRLVGQSFAVYKLVPRAGGGVFAPIDV